MQGYERVLLVKPRVFIYRIPPLRSVSRGYKASDWNLDNPDWKGRMRLITIDDKCILKLEDETSGELYAQAPIVSFPGPGIQAVTDSSRYFVVRVQSDTGRTAYLGMGFADRADSFDLNVALHDNFKSLESESKANNEGLGTVAPKLDLSLKGGNISLNLNLKNGDSATTSSRTARASHNSDTKIISGGMIFLPPPPGSKPRPTSKTLGD
ncbi:Adaptin ear-binding coat-associated protein 1, partial [Fragariocoptes setiger]